MGTTGLSPLGCGGDPDADPAAIMKGLAVTALRYEEDVNPVATITAGIPRRKPGQYQRYVIARTHVAQTTLLVSEVQTGLRKEKVFYAVSPTLQPLIGNRLRNVLVIPWWSMDGNSWSLWFCLVSDTGWHQSVARLLMRPDSFFAEHELVTHADLQAGRYVTRAFRRTNTVPALTQPIDALLADALGPDHFITTPDHPVFRSLTEGTVIE